MIKAVIFDVDGVLIDSFEANLKFFQSLMVYFGYSPPSREVYKKMFHLHMMDVISILTKSKSEEEIKKIWMTGKERSKVPYPDELTSTPKNLETILKALNKDYVLGIVTNRIRNGVYTLPQLAKLKKYFKVVIYYEDTIKHKPDPDPLLLAAKKLAVKPTDTVYIGDQQIDIQAAKAAGMKIIIYSKNKLNGADANTSLFDKLPVLIKALSLK